MFSTMNRPIDISAVKLLTRMLTGDPVESIESAKGMIGISASGLDEILIDVILDKRYSKWSRIAAIYVLGFSGKRTYTSALVGILNDVTEPTQIRDHAAEALGNLRSRQAVDALEKALRSKNIRPRVKKSIIYALSEIRATSNGVTKASKGKSLSKK
jgi:HEAT repeat protein